MDNLASRMNEETIAPIEEAGARAWFQPPTQSWPPCPDRLSDARTCSATD